MKDKATARRCGVNVFRNRLESDTSLSKGLNDLYQVRKRTPETIKLPDHEHVSLTAVVQCMVETWPLCHHARNPVLKNITTARLNESGSLQIQILILG